MIARACFASLLLCLVGCSRPTEKPVTPASAPVQDHQFAIYGVNGQSFLVDGKTGDVWIYGDTPDGKGFTSVPVLGLGGVMRQYNPQTKKLEHFPHRYSS
jgi:hypothetical protein